MWPTDDGVLNLSFRNNWFVWSFIYQRPGRCAVCNYMYPIIHSPQGFLGRIYNTGQRNLPDCSVAGQGKEPAFRFPFMF